MHQLNKDAHLGPTNHVSQRPSAPGKLQRQEGGGRSLQQVALGARPQRRGRGDSRTEDGGDGTAFTSEWSARAGSPTKEGRAREPTVPQTREGEAREGGASPGRRGRGLRVGASASGGTGAVYSQQAGAAMPCR